MLNTFRYSLPDAIQNQVTATLAEWNDASKVSRIWQKDASVWTNDDEAKWLGWLDIVDEELAGATRYETLQADIAEGGFTDVLLMGMGGSSLCPEVLAVTFGKTNFHILDSTDPAQIAATEQKLDLDTTLFIVASKSGSTLEPNCFKQHFFEKVAERRGRENAGRQFIAITDPGSKMEQVAKDDGFRHIFYGRPEIGGRFSALSAFGLTAAASMGLMVDGFLGNAREMVNECRVPDASLNPGALLGTILGVCHANKRDKLTIVTSDAIYDVGAWLEQLVAESTGKNGVAIIPIDREPIVSPDFSDDRVFAFLSAGDDNRIEELYDNLSAAGHPCVHIVVEVENLGQEFFRWEFATAVAGSVMGINPFNQPDVEAAKIETRQLTDEYEQTGSLPDETPFFEGDGLKFFSNSPVAGSTAAEIVTTFINENVKPHDYFAILAYIEMNDDTHDLLQIVREKVGFAKNVATCLGFGPRFLHSTGQAYKGGGNNGVFLQITCDDAADLQVPGQKYTFGIVKAAQARGDLQVLQDRHRRTLRIHLGPDVIADLEKIVEMI
jgi:transaldolase/glucose-6-phosphate isomerase